MGVHTDDKEVNMDTAVRRRRLTLGRKVDVRAEPWKSLSSSHAPSALMLLPAGVDAMGEWVSVGNEGEVLEGEVLEGEVPSAFSRSATAQQDATVGGSGRWGHAAFAVVTRRSHLGRACWGGYTTGCVGRSSWNTADVREHLGGRSPARLSDPNVTPRSHRPSTMACNPALLYSGFPFTGSKPVHIALSAPPPPPPPPPPPAPISSQGF
eukprot:1179757-Prorocentrum_minimum.AAC.2